MSDDLSNSQRRFRFHEYIEPWSSAIPLGFTKEEETLFMRTCHAPEPSDDDMLPVPMKNLPEVKLNKKYLSEKAATSPDETKYKRLQELSLSTNPTVEDAFRFAIERYNKLVEAGAEEDALKSYIKDRSEYILCFKFTPLCGKMEEFKDGHSNFLPYEDVHLSDMLVKTECPYFIDYQNNTYRRLESYDESDA